MQSSSRNGAKVIWLAVHTTEGIMRARDLLNWASWAGSSHASNDETGVLLTPADGFVAYDRSAWTLRNGNPISENIEQCGWARWTRAEWLARPKLLDTTARWLADRSKARGIPLVRLSDADIRARKPGVIGHGDYSRATGDGTHTDPGPNYPWDVVLAKANAYRNGTPQEDDMTPEQDAMLRKIHFELTNQFPSRVPGSKVKETAVGYLLNADNSAYQSLQLDRAQSAAITALSKLVAEQNGLTIEGVQQAVEAAIAKGVDVDVTVASGSA